MLMIIDLDGKTHIRAVNDLVVLIVEPFKECIYILTVKAKSDFW